MPHRQRGRRGRVGVDRSLAAGTGNPFHRCHHHRRRGRRHHPGARPGPNPGLGRKHTRATRPAAAPAPPSPVAAAHRRETRRPSHPRCHPYGFSTHRNASRSHSRWQWVFAHQSSEINSFRRPPARHRFATDDLARLAPEGAGRSGTGRCRHDVERRADRSARSPGTDERRVRRRAGPAVGWSAHRPAGRRARRHRRNPTPVRPRPGAARGGRRDRPGPPPIPAPGPEHCSASSRPSPPRCPAPWPPWRRGRHRNTAPS